MKLVALLSRRVLIAYVRPHTISSSSCIIAAGPFVGAQGAIKREAAMKGPANVDVQVGPNRPAAKPF